MAELDANLTRHPRLLIRASAGTGKTHQLTTRYLRLLADNTPPSRILATTFTRKAAGEIFSRIVERLVDAAESDKAASQLGQSLEIDPFGRQQAHSLLQELTRNLASLRIATLDGFFTELAMTHARQLRLPYGWRTVDRASPQQQFALERLLAESNRHDIVRLVQWLAKGESSRSVGDLMLKQVRDLYEIYVDSESLAGAPWTFFRERMKHASTAEAGQLLEVEELDGIRRDLENVHAGPIISSVPQRHRDAIGRISATAVAEDWKAVLEQTLIANVLRGDGTYYRQPVDSRLVELLYRLGNHARAQQIQTAIQHTEGAYELLQRFDTFFQDAKHRTKTFVFNDLPRLLSQHLVTNRNLAKDSVARNQWMESVSQIDHLLLDEFQDTSLSQWETIVPFVRRTMEPQTRRSFFCVGDRKQSIYEWRGGVPELLDHILQQFPELECAELAMSRRSCQAIIEIVNRVFTQLDKHNNLEDLHAVLKKWCRDFPIHETAQQHLQGYVTLRHAEPSEGETEEPKPAFDTAVGIVRQLIQAGPNHSVAVLMNTNDHVAEMLYRLQQEGIHAGEAGGAPLTDSAAVRVILSALTLIDHPGNSAAAFQVRHSPLSEFFFGEHLPDPSHSIPLAAMRLRSQLLRDGYGAVLTDWARRLKPVYPPREAQRLDQLCEMTYQWHFEWKVRTLAFRERIRETRVPLTTAAQVTVMTVHQSKGLQFDNVVLCDLDATLSSIPTFVLSRDADSLQPAAICRYQNKAVQAILPKSVQRVFAEHAGRRLQERIANLYVAMTRAVHGLHFVVAPSSKGKHPKTLGGLVVAALLENGELPQDEIFEYGQADWQRLE